MAPFSNPFTKKKREFEEKQRLALAAQQASLHQLHARGQIAAASAAASSAGGQRAVVRQPSQKPASSVLDLLVNGQDALQRLRGLPPSDMEAFPLLNEAQRTVQQLKSAVAAGMPQADQDIWNFQIAELAEEIRGQTDRIMSGTGAALAEHPTPVNHPERRPGGAGSRSLPHSPPSAQPPLSGPHYLPSNSTYLSTPSRPALQRPSSSITRISQGAGPAPAGIYPSALGGVVPRSLRRNTYQPPPPAPLPASQVFSPSQPQPAGSQQSQQHFAPPALQPCPLQQLPSQPPPLTLEQPSTPQALLAARLMGGASELAQVTHAPNAQHMHSQPSDSAQAEQLQSSAPHQEEDLFSGLSVAEGASAHNTYPAPPPPLTSNGSPRHPTQLPHSSTQLPPNSTQLPPSSSQLPPSSPASYTIGSGPRQSATALHAKLPPGSSGPASAGGQVVSLPPPMPSHSRNSSIGSSHHRHQGGEDLGEQSSYGPSKPHASSMHMLGQQQSGLPLVSLGLLRRQSSSLSVQNSSNSAWSAGMAAAAAASHAAQSGLSVDELGAHKLIRKHTRGYKIGYAANNLEPAMEQSSVVPGQPMPGPQYSQRQQGSILGSPAPYQQGPGSQQQQGQQQQGPGSQQQQGHYELGQQQGFYHQSQQQGLQQQGQGQQQQQQGQQGLGQQQGQQQAPDQQGTTQHTPAVLALMAQRQAYLNAQAQALRLAIQQQEQVQPDPDLPQQRQPSRAMQGTLSEPEDAAAAMTNRLQSFTTKGALSPGQQEQGTQQAQQVNHQQQQAQPAYQQQQHHAYQRLQQASQKQQQASPAFLQHRVSPGGSMPPFKVTSQDPLKDLESYLHILTGPIKACQHAATVAAAQLVQALATAIQAALAQQRLTNDRSRGALEQLGSTNSQLAQLEAQQAAAIEGEDFEAAAVLDVRLGELGGQRDALQGSLKQLRGHAAALAARQGELVAGQAAACAMVADYLSRLQSNHARLLTALEQSAAEEAAGQRAAWAAASERLDVACMALAQQKVAAAAAREDADARGRQAAAPLQRQRMEATTHRDALVAEVAVLRAALVEREAALAAAEGCVVEAEAALRAHATRHVAANASLQEEQQALVAQEDLLAAQGQELEVMLQQQGQQQEAAAAQRKMLEDQGSALAGAVLQLREMAGRINARVQADTAAAGARAAREGAAETTQRQLDELLRRMAECRVQQAAHQATRAAANAQAVAAAERAAAASAALPTLEAAKRAAAARRDFQEAARLTSEARAAAAAAESAAAASVTARAAVAAAATASDGIASELEQLTAVEPRARKAAAAARYELLQAGAAARVAQLSVAVGNPDLIEVLQAEGELEAAEATQLAATWGFITSEHPSAVAMQAFTTGQARQGATSPPSVPPPSYASRVGSRSNSSAMLNKRGGPSLVSLSAQGSTNSLYEQDRGSGQEAGSISLSGQSAGLGQGAGAVSQLGLTWPGVGTQQPGGWGTQQQGQQQGLQRMSGSSSQQECRPSQEDSPQSSVSAVAVEAEPGHTPRPAQASGGHLFQPEDGQGPAEERVLGGHGDGEQGAVVDGPLVDGPMVDGPMVDGPMVDMEQWRSNELFDGLELVGEPSEELEVPVRADMSDTTS